MFGLGSSSQLGIGIAIRLHDQFSGTAAKVNQQLLEMRKNANSAAMGAMKDYRNQALIIAGGATAITAGMMQAAKQGAEFQHAINQVFIVGGKEMGRSRDQLGKFATDMSKTFTRTPTEIAQAMFENAKQGLTEGIEQITRYQVAVSTATDEAVGGTEGVAANLLNIMNAMKLSTGEFPRIANAVTAVANATQASVYSIGESMQYAAFTAHSFNIPLETTLAMVGKLAQVGIRGTSAGTAINNALTQMAKSLGPFQTKGQLAAWKMLGLEIEQVKSMANAGDFTGIITAVSEATKGMGAIDKKAILTRVFNMRGTRGIEGMSDIFNEKGNKSIADILKAAKDGVKDDIAMKQAHAMMNDLHSDFKLFTNAIHRFKIAFVEAAGPVLRIVMSVATKVMGVLSSIMDSPVGSIFASIVAIGAPVVGVLFAFRAAALTATIALRTLSMASGVGGFGGLMRSGMGMIGMGRMGPNGGKFTAANPAGLRRVVGGQTIDFGGKTFKGGQMLPRAFNATLGAGAAGAGIGAGLASRGVGFLGTMTSFLGRMVPWVGAILLATETLKALGFNAEARENRKNNDFDALYFKNLDAQYMGYTQNNGYYRGAGGSMHLARQQSPQLNQSINVMVDGRAVLAQQFNQAIDASTLNSDINFNVQD